MTAESRSRNIFKCIHQGKLKFAFYSTFFITLRLHFTLVECRKPKVFMYDVFSVFCAFERCFFVSLVVSHSLTSAQGWCLESASIPQYKFVEFVATADSAWKAVDTANLSVFLCEWIEWNINKRNREQQNFDHWKAEKTAQCDVLHVVKVLKNQRLYVITVDLGSVIINQWQVFDSKIQFKKHESLNKTSSKCFWFPANVW